LSAGEVGADGVGRVAVEVVAGSVVAAGGAGVGVAGGVVHVPERGAGVECGGYEGLAQGVVRWLGVARLAGRGGGRCGWRRDGRLGVRCSRAAAGLWCVRR
jgi:hypothetical protein